MTSEVLRVERRGAAALLTIDRPHAGNSISAEVTAALDEAITGYSVRIICPAIVHDAWRRMTSRICG